MPTKVSHEKQAWVKTNAPKKPKASKYVNRAEQKEALCARLRYFACKPLDSSDRIRMLNRPFEGANNGYAGMVDVDRAPSPVPDQWTGAGLKFENGARGGGGGAIDRRKLRRDRDRGFDMESVSDSGSFRAVSEPVAGPLVISRAPTQADKDDIIQQADELNLIKEEILRLRHRREHEHDHDSERYHRRHKDHHYKYEKHEDPIPTTIPRSYYFHDYHDTKSYRSISPSPPPPLVPPSPPPSPPPPLRQPYYQQPTARSSYERRPDYDPYPYYSSPSPQTYRPQVRNVTAPISTSSPSFKPTPPRASAPLSSTYKFQSAIFKSKESANHYRSFYEKSRRDGNVGPGSWASATSALSFD